MYCTRCGKKIDYDSFVCNECLAAEEALKNQSQEYVSQSAAADNQESDFVAAGATGADKTESTNTNQQYYYSAPNPTYTYQTVYNSQQNTVPSGNPRMIGFGKSLASLILSEVGAVFSAIAFFVTGMGAVGAGIVLFMMALGMAIPALVLGIQSIKTSSRVAAQNLPRPILTLIFGIIGTASAGSALYCLFMLTILGAI